jgi:hypothetical protein
LAELVIALATGVVAAGVLVLVGPLSWARLFPGIARSAARHAERFSPRLARWYDLEDALPPLRAIIDAIQGQRYAGRIS